TERAKKESKQADNAAVKDAKPQAEKPAAVRIQPSKAASEKDDLDDAFDRLVGSEQAKVKSKSDGGKAAAAKDHGKKADYGAVDPLDDLLDTLLSEQETIGQKKTTPAAKQPPKPEPAAPAADARPRMPANFNEDVTTDIDAVFQSRVRAEAAAMAQAAH